MKNLKLRALWASIAMIGMVGGAQAGGIPVSFFGNSVNQLSDNDAEYLINADGTRASLTGDSKVQAGDTIRGIITIDTIEDLTGGTGTKSIGGASPTNELTGMLWFKVKTVTDKCAPGDLACQATPDSTRFTYTYEADPAFAAFLDAQVNVPYTAAQLAGTMIAIFEDSANNYSRLGGTTAAALATDEANAIDGTFRVALGIVSASDFLVSTSFTDDILAVKGVAPPSSGGLSNMGMTFIKEDFAQDFGKVSCLLGPVNVCGSTSLLGTASVATPFDIFTNTDFTIFVVPEPGTLLLSGLGLFGAGFARRRKA